MDTEKSAPYGALLFWQDNALFGHPVAFYRAGKISKKQADAKAEAEYERYAAAQRQLKEAQGESDIAELLNLQPKK